MNSIRFSVGNDLKHFNDGGDPGFEIGIGYTSIEDGHAIFADGLWIGGYDLSYQLRLAAVTYRTGGVSDFYPGPLSNNGFASTTDDNCSEFDRIWKSLRTDAIMHHQYFDHIEAGNTDILNNPPFLDYSPPDYFYEWPAHNFDSAYDFFLAPFHDRDGDGIYDPDAGDYPGYDLFGQLACDDGSDTDIYRLHGHETAWYVANDNGGPHAESGGNPLGLEIQTMVYAFEGSTINDPLHDAVFSDYRLINRSSNTLHNTHVGKWTDFYLGCPTDDYAGCDVSRGFGFAYNANPFDSDCVGVPGFGSHVPTLAIDFLRGPLMDADGLDNPLTQDSTLLFSQNGIPYSGLGQGFGDGIIDNERMTMRKFLVGEPHDNTPDMPDPNHPPESPLAHYYYLTGRWTNGQLMTFGQDGLSGTIACDFMMPGQSDPVNYGTAGVDPGPWVYTNVFPANRRFLMSSGPFTFEPGEVEHLSFSHFYAENQDDNQEMNILRIKHDQIQTHFDYCFQLVPEVALDVQSYRLDPYLRIYPNPTSDLLYIETSGDIEITCATLYDSSGRKLLVRHDPDQADSILDVSTFDPGLYHLVIKLGGQRLIRSIFIE